MRILNRTVVSWSVVGFFCFVLLFAGCDADPRNKSHADVPLTSIKEGKALAATYCQSCHLLPDPALVDAKSWEKGVLPMMGPRLGIFYHGGNAYPSRKYDGSLGPNFYPAKPVITAAQWQHILDYYTATAPDSLPQQPRAKTIPLDLSLFAVDTPSLPYRNAMTSFIKIDETNGQAPLIIADAGLNKTYFLNRALQPVDSVSTKGPVVDLQLFQNTILACNIGVLNPNNGTFGSATYFRASSTGKWKADTAMLFSGLRRPVQVSAADLTNDGRLDYLICEFGFLTGSLCWMEAKGNAAYQRHVLRPLPGAVKAYFQDYNKDGRMDIWVLFAQGEEGVFLYTNEGNGRFVEKQVLRFPSVYGSSYFELADFNNDGAPDIVYTCGDNADYSTILKPYHGAYIFMNDGKNGFTQEFFFPIHGCYKALARDFDKDGDLDLATISYFADYARQPEEGFVYLENKGNFRFEPQSLEVAKQGRWLTMDVGDIDGDGWTDIVLGNFCLGPTLSKSVYDWRKQAPILVLKNKGEKTQ